MTVSQLNMSWIVAPANARLNSRWFPDCAMDTNVLVTLVPMFAPMTIGMARGTVITEKYMNTYVNTFFILNYVRNWPEFHN